MIRKDLYISDLDGTLLNGDARLAPASAQLLNDALAQGVAFTVATARTPATVDPLLHEVNMRLPAIVMTGAAWWHFDTRSYSHIKRIPHDDASQLIEIFAEHDIHPFVYTLADDDGSSVLKVYNDASELSAAERKFVSEREGLPLKTFFIGRPVDKESARNVLLFFAMGERRKLAQAVDTIRKNMDCALSFYDDIYNPGMALVEVFAPGVSKAAAIVEMKKELKPQNVIVFGDNLNDLSMFEVADTSVAVANASEEVKSAADIVIGDNNDDSVPRFIVRNSLK